jgi:hypothetical protein
MEDESTVDEIINPVETNSLQYIHEINRKTKEALMTPPASSGGGSKVDVEMGLSPEEKGCLITDMLGLRGSIKTPELLVSSFNSSELSKLAIREDPLGIELYKARELPIRQIVSDTLDEILRPW